MKTWQRIKNFTKKILHREAELQRRDIKYGKLRRDNIAELVQESLRSIIVQDYVTAYQCLELALDELAVEPKELVR